MRYLARVQGQADGASGLGRRDGLALVLLALVTSAVYARSLAGELVHDDLELIARNPGIADFGRIVASGSWDFLGPGAAEYIGYWRPLAALAYALTWPLGRSHTPWFHGLSLACHLAATVAAFHLARRLVRSLSAANERAHERGSWIALATATLFALHPVQVESVAWISALNGPLSGCLGLFALERFLAWRERGSRGLPLAAAALFALALLAKEMAVALLPLALLIDLLRADPAREGARAHAPATLGGFGVPPEPGRAYGPFIAAFGAYLVARMLVFRSPWAGLDRSVELAADALRLGLLRVEILGGALELLTLPIDLVLMRPFRPHVEWLDPALVRALVFSAVYLALLAASLRARARVALAALAFVPLGFLPVLTHTSALGAFPLCERFLYLSAFGFALGTALLLAHAFRPRAATAVLLALGALYAARSFARAGVWRDEETLFRATAVGAPRAVAAWTSLGRALLQASLESMDAHKQLEARAAFERAAALLEEAKRERGHSDLDASQSDYLNVNLGLASCEMQAGDLAAAILMLEDLAQRVESIQADVRAAQARGLPVQAEPLELHRVYTVLGSAQLERGEVEQAERSYARALELYPAFAEGYRSRGRMYVRQGRWPEAVRDLQEAARLRPGEPGDRLLLAQALHGQGEYAQAEALARELVAELPASAEPLLVLAACALRRGETGPALTWLDRVLALEPRNHHAWYQRARALLARGDASGALTAFRNAVEIAPSNFEAHYDLASFLLGQGADAEAKPYLLRAYTLSPHAHRAALRRSLESLELDSAELHELAEADAGRGEPEWALRWVERRLAAAPEDARAALARARLLRRLGRDEEALATFRAAADRAPASFEIWSELGAYLHALERPEEAKTVIEHALELEVPASYPPEVRATAKNQLRKMLE